MKRVETDLLKDMKQEFSIAEAVYNHCTTMREFHYHKHYELLYVTKHSRIFWAGGKEYRLSQDCIALIPPLTPHRTESGGIFPERRILVNFQRDFVQPISQALGVDLLVRFRPDAPVVACAEQKKEVIRLLTDLLKNQKEQSDRQANNLLLFSQLLLLLRPGEPFVLPQDETMSRMVAYVEQNHREPLTLDQLAQVFFMSRYTVSRKFKSYTGISFVKYLTTVRLIHAKRLLEQEESSVTAAALRSGFESLSAFDRVFRKEMGITPMEYKKQQRTT